MIIANYVTDLVQHFYLYYREATFVIVSSRPALELKEESRTNNGAVVFEFVASVYALITKETSYGDPLKLIHDRIHHSPLVESSDLSYLNRTVLTK